MSTNNSEWLREQIIEFMSVVEENLSSTTYAIDRSVYMADLALLAQWLVKLHKKVPPAEVASEIISPQTDKRFGDYWRQGKWGENEAAALKSLQDAIRSYGMF
jgi:hypothetical protein